MESSVYSKDSLYISHIKDISFRCSQCPYIPLIQINQNKNNGFEIETLCRNKHKNNCLIESFIEKACVYNLNSVICSSCNLTNNEEENGFVYCNICKCFYCDHCKSIHQKEHVLISVNKFDSTCNIHNDKIIGYCKDCGNMCLKCHFKHDQNHIFNVLKLISSENLQKIKEKINNDEKIYCLKANEYYKKINELTLNIQKIKSEIEMLNVKLDLDKKFIFIEKKLLEIYQKQNDRMEYCYEIIKNLENCLNVKLDFENKVFNKEKYLIKKLKPLKFNICSECDNILQANNDEISITILNLKEIIKNSDNKINLYLFYIPLFGLKTSIKINFKDNINNIKDVKKLLFQSNNNFHIESNNLLFYEVSDSQFEGVMTENSRIKGDMYIFISPINQMISQNTHYIPLYMISKKVLSAFPRILLIEKNNSFRSLLLKIFYFTRNYINIPQSQNKFTDLLKKNENLDSYLELISFMNEEFNKIEKKESYLIDFYNNLPFNVYLQNQTINKYIIWGPKDYGNDLVKIHSSNDSIEEIIDLINLKQYKLYLEFDSNSKYLENEINLNKCETIYYSKNIIHESLEKQLQNNEIKCPNCDKISKLEKSVRLPELCYIFILDKKIYEEGNKLFFEENINHYILYEKDNINLIKENNSLEESEKNKLIEFLINNNNSILYLKRRSQDDINFIK